MGVNWAIGMMRWKPHIDGRGSHPLNHLHPFQFQLELEATKNYAACVVTVQVGFALHSFTRERTPGDAAHSLYGDHREERTFDDERYRLSCHLPALIKGLKNKHCAYAGGENFVSIETVDDRGRPIEYGVFFIVRREGRAGENTVRLIVQSAYPLYPGKRSPARGRVTFRTILGAALQGKKLRAR